MPEKKKPSSVNKTPATTLVALDDFDRKILAAVQNNNIQPLHEIAARVNLSVPAVARRLQRLRAERIILKDVSIVDPAAVGYLISLIVEVCVENELIENLDAVKARFLACPHILHCYYVTGEVDFILIMALRDMLEYERLTRELFFKGGNVKSFKTFVAMTRVKIQDELLL